MFLEELAGQTYRRAGKGLGACGRFMHIWHRWSRFKDTQSSEMAVMSRVKEIFGLPKDWLPPAMKREAGIGGSLSVVASSFTAPDKEEARPSFLSPEGKRQLAAGQRICRPADIDYIGDPMLRPLETWEVARLADVLVGLSIWLNKFFGKDQGFYDEASPQSGLFPDEGPSLAIRQGKLWEEISQRRGWRRTFWFVPSRVNVRLLADLRALLILATGGSLIFFLMWLIPGLMWALLTTAVPGAILLVGLLFVP
ncbi:unnamed protein product [Discosporangium mesarthrocarpum]